MSETKLNLIKRLPKFVVLGHGAYVENPKRFVVPPDRVYIFVSRASRYCPRLWWTNTFTGTLGVGPRWSPRCSRGGARACTDPVMFSMT